MKILLATTRAHELEEFISGLGLEEHEPLAAESGQEVMSLVSSIKPALVIVDDSLPGYDALEVVRKIVSQNPMVNTAVITDMKSGQFHEQSEGLGVLCALPQNPGPEDARKLIRDTQKILMLSRQG
jgi:DNA-binding response OmpR family regulator